MANKSTGKLINDGKDSEGIFERWIRSLGFAIFRLRDKRDLHGLNNRSVAAFGQPSDYVVVTPTGAYLAEVKSTQEKTSFPFSCFTKAQVAAMAQCFSCNVADNYIVYIHNLNTNQWYFTNANHIITIFKKNRKSLRWEELSLLGEI